MSQNIWQKQGTELHKQARRAQVVRRALKDTSVKRVLDIGCAEGYTTSFISEISNFIVGVELNIDNLKIAKSRVKQVSFINASIEHLPFRDNCFDAVCILEVLEHLPNELQHTGIKEADRVLHSNGLFLVSVPYKENIIHTFCIHCGKLTPLYGHLHSLDEVKIAALIPSLRFKVIKKYHLPNLQIISCSNIFKPLPLTIWLLINNFLALIRKGYWVVMLYLKV
jgi:ubiquinone/menaquinone biosynthesis C-methylase UbiE